ncbi:MAG: hypothetical protein G8345_06215 [Magnetococcales bacterium]|nr:hypothetical protein [Magnetococcales bacterium]NGZ26464.1 hypothetical protein [Magnetococcales bacterium]
MMRVTQGVFIRQSVAAMQKKMQELQRSQEESLTGNRILTPADDPGGAFRDSIFSSDLSGVESLQKTTSVASSRLSLASEKLGMIHDNMLDASELAVTMGNGYQGDPATMRNLSYKTENIFDDLLKNINIEADGMPLFSGGRTRNPYDPDNPTTTTIRMRGSDTAGFSGQNNLSIATDATGNSTLDPSDANYPGLPTSVKMTYNGGQFDVMINGDTDPSSPVAYGATMDLGWVQIDSASVPTDGQSFYFEIVPKYQGGLEYPKIKISDQQSVAGNMTGDEVMEGKNGRGQNLFGAIAGLNGALKRADPHEVNAWIGQLEEARGQASDSETVTGMRQVQVETVTATLDEEKTSLNEIVAKNKEADMFDVLSRMEQTIQALQVMTTSERNILGVSLVDLLR